MRQHHRKVSGGGVALAWGVVYTEGVVYAGIINGIQSINPTPHPNTSSIYICFTDTLTTFLTTPSTAPLPLYPYYELYTIASQIH